MKKTLIVGLLAVLIAAFIGYKVYNKPHRKLGDEPGIAIKADALLESFIRDEAAANLAYLDKVLEVDGIVSSISINQDGKQVIYLETNDPLFGISCTLDQSVDALDIGESVTIKGFCKGYLSDVVLTSCKIVE